MNKNDGDLGNFFQSKKKKGTKKKQAQADEAPKEEKLATQEEVKQEITATKTEDKKANPVNTDEAAFMKQSDNAYESSDEEKAEINIDADSVIKDTKEVEKQKRLEEERETGNKMGWDVIAKKGNNSSANTTTTSSRADFGTKKPEQQSTSGQASSTGPIQFKRGSGPPTFKKSNAFGNKTEFPTFEGGKGGKNNNQPLEKDDDQQNVIRSEQSSTGHFGMLAASARQQEAPREEQRKPQASMPIFKGKAKIGGGAPQVAAASTEETKAHNYDTGFMTRNVRPKGERHDDGDRKMFNKNRDNSDEEDNRRNFDVEDDFNTVTEKKREFKKGGAEGYPKQKKQFGDYQQREDGAKSNNFNFQKGGASKAEETNEFVTSAAATKKTASKPAQLPDKADWSNVFGSQ